MSAENIIKTLANGDATSTDEIITLDFGGHTWHVKAFIGFHPQAALLLEGSRSLADPTDMITAFIRAACVVMAKGGGKRKVAKRLLADLITAEYDMVADNFERLPRPLNN